MASVTQILRCFCCCGANEYESKFSSYCKAADKVLTIEALLPIFQQWKEIFGEGVDILSNNNSKVGEGSRGLVRSFRIIPPKHYKPTTQGEVYYILDFRFDESRGFAAQLLCDPIGDSVHDINKKLSSLVEAVKQEVGDMPRSA